MIQFDKWPDELFKEPTPFPEPSPIAGMMDQYAEMMGKLTSKINRPKRLKLIIVTDIGDLEARLSLFLATGVQVDHFHEIQKFDSSICLPVVYSEPEIDH